METTDQMEHLHNPLSQRSWGTFIGLKGGAPTNCQVTRKLSLVLSITSKKSTEEESWIRIGAGLNTLNRILQKHVASELSIFETSLPRYYKNPLKNYTCITEL